MSYKRVLLKLSGEVFGGGKVGVDPDSVAGIAREIASLQRAGFEVAVVTGGGSFFRAAELQQRGMDRARADYMGTLGIVMICLRSRTSWRRRGSKPGCRPPARWARSPSRTSRGAPSGTSRRAAWCSSA